MKFNKASIFRWIPRINITGKYMYVRGWRISWLGFELWTIKDAPALRKKKEVKQDAKVG